MFWSAFGDVLPQAVGIALSPVPIALVILVLISARARTNGPAFALGWFLAVTFAVGLLTALGHAADADTDTSASDGVNLVQVLLGLLLLGLAARSWRKRPRAGETPPPPKLFGAADSMSLPAAFGVGALFAVVNPKNLPLEISAAGRIAQAGLSGAESAALVILFALLASATVLVPVVAYLVLGERARSPLAATKDWLLANNATIMTVLFLVLGAKVLGQGLALFA
jgi:hypothetical protein